jgi:hypothetical protein
MKQDEDSVMNTSRTDNTRPHYKNSILSEKMGVHIMYRWIIVIKDFVVFW